MIIDVRHGDSTAIMATLDADSVDAVVTDPPYGFRLMGRHWDGGVPGVDAWAQALRVAKPGAHLLAFGGTRTVHRLAVAIEAVDMSDSSGADPDGFIKVRIL